MQRYKIGQRLKMKSNHGGYDFKGCPITGYVVVKGYIREGNLYECFIEGYSADSKDTLNFFEDEVYDDSDPMTQFKVGDVVRIKGDKEDFTDHLDGLLGVVLDQKENDVYLSVWKDGQYTKWFAWSYNLELA